MTDAPAILVDLARARTRADGTPVVVGIAGAVASGKSTLAAAVARESSARGTPADVVGTDGFLYPNSLLSERGLLARKGFPESYDVDALRAFVDAVHSGVGEVVVPRYSHLTYDVMEGEPLALRGDAAVVVEGVNALGTLADRLDLAVYVHAEEADLERWYVTRFLELRAEAETDPGSFYRQFLAMSVEDTEALARQTWREVNLVNLREHIGPTLELADCVVVKGPDHTVTAVETREHRRAAGEGKNVTTEANADQDLVQCLDEVWASMIDLGAGLSEAEWKEPTEVPGWSVQDNLAHIEGLEWMLLGREQPDHEVPEDLAHVKNDIGRRNEIWVDSRRGFTGADVLAEFREVTAARIAQLRGFGPDDFAGESWTPVGPGTVRDLLPFRIFDSWVHEQDMRRAVGRPGDLDSRVAAVSLDRIVGAMPFVVGKRAGAPDGATIVFELSGPLARAFAIGVDGGRAKVLDAPPTAPDARVLTDTETFARLGCGRIDPSAALADARVRLEGDEALGRRVVEQSNFLF